MIWSGEWASGANDFDPANPAAIRSAFKYEFNVPIGGQFTLPLHTNAAAVANPVLPSLREHAPMAFPYAGYYMYKQNYDAVKQEWNEISTKEGASAKGGQGCKIRIGGEPVADAYRPADVQLKDVIGVSGDGLNPYLGKFTISGCYHAASGRIWVWKVYPPRNNRPSSAPRARTATTTSGDGAEPPKTRMRSEINDLTTTAVSVIGGVVQKEDDAPKVNPKFNYEPVPRDLQLMMGVYLAIRNHKFRPTEFIRAVDASTYPDYYEKITSPMWLDEVEQRLTSGAYKNADEFRADMRLIWDNARRYSPKETSVHQDAIYFEKIMAMELEKADRILTREIKMEREKREREEEDRRKQEEEIEKEKQRREERKRKEEEIRRKKEEDAAKRAAAAASHVASHSNIGTTSSHEQPVIHDLMDHNAQGDMNSSSSAAKKGKPKATADTSANKGKGKMEGLTVDPTNIGELFSAMTTFMQAAASQMAASSMTNMLQTPSMVQNMQTMQTMQNMQNLQKLLQNLPQAVSTPQQGSNVSQSKQNTTSSTAKKAPAKSTGKRVYDEDDGSDIYDDDEDYKRKATTKRSAAAAANKKARKSEPTSSSSSSSSANDWFQKPLSLEEKEKLIEDAGSLNDQDMERLSQMIREEQVDMGSNSGEVELNVDDLPIPTLRRMQRFVAEKLGRPVPGPSAASTTSANTGGGRGRGRTPALPENEQRDFVSRAATVAQEQRHGTSSSSGPSRTIFDDDDDVAPPPPF